MYRISPCIIRTTTLLLRRTPLELQAVRISRNTAHQYKKPQDIPRDPCPQPPKPCPPPKNNFYFWGAVAFLLMTGGFAVYAQQKPEVRDWLSIHVPWFDDLIAVAYQENYPLLENAVFAVARVKQYIKSLMDEKPTPKECLLDGPGLAITDSATAEGAGGDDDDEDDEDDEDEEEDDDLTEEQSPCDVLPPPVITKDICELEECLKDLGDTVYNNYLTARDACLYYNKLVKHTMNNFCYMSMKKLRPEMEDRKELVQKSIDNAKSVQVQLNDVTRYIECGCQATPERLQITRDLLQEYRDKIKTMTMEFDAENQKSIASDTQWQMVETLLDQYVTQITSMYPELDYTARSPEMTGDADLLLITTKKYVENLKPQVKDYQEAMTDRINRAVKTINMPSKEKEQKIATDFKKALADLEKDYNDRYAHLKADHDNELKSQLKRQKERHEEALAKKLEIKEKETNAKLKKQVEEAVEAQKKLFAIQLKEMALRLAIIEGKLNAKLKAERESKRAQLLYAVGSSLLRATKKANQYVNVEKELTMLAENTGEADGDKLVSTVLESIPGEVWEKGVMPENALRKNYKSMEGVAMSVAMVEKEGAILPVYAFSWLQSVFLFMRLSTIPQAELDKAAEQFEHLDTFDLLQRARYFVERGNIAKAVRYVNALEGASRGAAEAWYNTANAHVQTRQAAEAILAHAARLCLQYI